jgi:riboflavin synthase
MFTGLVEEAGEITSLKKSAAGIRLGIRSRVCAKGASLGDSIAVNGCCLTLAKRRRDVLEFDLLAETWKRTSFASLHVGGRVNLERSLAAGSRLGGHFVTGHVDATGVIRIWEPRGADWLLDIEAPAAVARYLIHKGSIAVDGISLTVAKVSGKRFQCWIIPHTRAVTSLSERSPGDRVNLEADLIGKYVERFAMLHRKAQVKAARF